MPSVLSSKCTILTTNVTNLEVQRKNIKQIPQLKPFQVSPKIIDFHKLGLVSPLFPVSASFKVLPRMKVSILRISVDSGPDTRWSLYTIRWWSGSLYIQSKYGNTSEPTLLPGKPFKGATTVMIQAPVQKRVIQPLHFNLSKSFNYCTENSSGSS